MISGESSSTASAFSGRSTIAMRLDERRRIRKRAVHGRGIVEVEIEAPFYPGSGRASVPGQPLLTGRQHIKVLAAGSHEDWNRRLQGRIGHQRGGGDEWIRGILLETVLEGEPLSDDLLLNGAEAGGRGGSLVGDVIPDRE
jgi:hypothetical protein